jgi:3-deoxy-manno-octulosonate cytidylyltransferase (CMP-KDO synthetase)
LQALDCYPVVHTASKPSVTVIIPARFDSSRLPGKPLSEIGGKPMVLHVVERSLLARRVSRVIVATDDKRIRNIVTEAGYEAVITSSTHSSGSDRIAEAARSLEPDEVIVNVQGDEPMIDPDTIDAVARIVLDDKNVDVSTASEPIHCASDVLNPNVVKVVVAGDGSALYFSRSPVPFPREAVKRHGGIECALAEEPELLLSFRKHTGIYAYKNEVLQRFTTLHRGKLEILEELEQLRALENGFVIKVAELEHSSIGVDTEEDLERARALFGETRAV